MRWIRITVVTTDKKVTEILKSVDGTDVLWQMHCNREAVDGLQCILLFQSACWIPVTGSYCILPYCRLPTGYRCELHCRLPYCHNSAYPTSRMRYLYLHWLLSSISYISYLRSIWA